MGEFFASAKDWLGTHRVEVYNPVLRTVNTFVHSLFIIGGGVVGGFVLARIFPEFFEYPTSAEETCAEKNQNAC